MVTAGQQKLHDGMKVIPKKVTPWRKFFVSRPIFALSLAIVIVLVGLISIMNLPIEQYPDITPPVVEVSATYDGADAETVNNAVATPVAQAVMGVSDMLYLQTTSANDGSMVMQVTFDIGSDPDLDAIFTQNNVSSATAELPATVTQQGVTTRKTMTGFLMVFSLHSDGRYDGGVPLQLRLHQPPERAAEDQRRGQRSRSWAPASTPCAYGCGPTC